MGQAVPIDRAWRDTRRKISIKTETEILKKASQALKEETGLRLVYKNLDLRGSRSDYHVDARLELQLEDKLISYLAEVRSRLNDTVIGEVALQAKRTPERLALVANYVTPKQAEKLRALNLPFLDAAGNAYIKEPGVFIFITGRKAAVDEENPLPIFSSRGVRVLFALLNKPGLETFDYRTIEEEAGVPRSTISRVMSGLEQAGYLTRRGGKERRLVKKAELIKRWVEAYAETFRAKLNPVRYQSTKYEGRWWEDVNLTEYNAFWGGEAGAARLTKYLRPQTATIYANSTLAKFQLLHGLVRDDRGEIEILKRFWTFGEMGDVAPPLVVYADLLATADERNLETAQMIYDKYLAPLTQSDS